MRPGDAKRVFDLAVGRSAPPLASMVTIFAISFHSPTLVAQFSIALSFASLFFVLPASIGAIFFSEMAASKGKGQSDSLISLMFWIVLLYTGFCFILVYWLPVISKTLISGLPEELLDGAISQARLIILCIPFFGIINVCGCVLESRPHTAIVAKFRMWQVFFPCSLCDCCAGAAWEE
ncbi:MULTISPECIES: MATE family efflux transporter [Delftia]|uniref:MATE family efflux transporter n=2 Tax=Delftia TaxID=80865 RepID=UPI002AD24256|nr:MATE family efflux transporter [Delftia tsuruhatensis]WQM81649.1 MATE family efflux transporter [Delftia tsuruhatensis]